MSYIGRGLQSGAFRQLDDISSGFDGSDTTHTMQVNSTNVTVGDVNQILLSLGGVIQKPGTDFTVSSSVLTFTTAPAANTSFFAILLGSDNGGTTTPTDKSVTVGKIDINGGELFLDADDDTSITADTDDQIDFKTGGTDRMHIVSGHLSVGASSITNGGGYNKVIQVSGTEGCFSALSGSNEGLFAQNGVNTQVINRADGYMQFRTNNTERMKLSDRGALLRFASAVYIELGSAGTTGGNSANWIRASGNNIGLNTNGGSYGFEVSGSAKVNFATDGTVTNANGSYGTISDERIKQDIVDANSQWNDIKAVKVRNYKKKEDVEKLGDSAPVHIGLVAQELETSNMTGLVIDETKYVETDQEVIDGEKNIGDIKDYKSVKHSILYMKAIKALQEAMAKIETLEADVKTLKGE